jgi:hypothetical protein
LPVGCGQDYWGIMYLLYLFSLEIRPTCVAVVPRPKSRVHARVHMVSFLSDAERHWIHGTSHLGRLPPWFGPSNALNLERMEAAKRVSTEEPSNANGLLGWITAE